MVTLGTRSGRVEGIEGDGVVEVRGIRYAEAPVGERRFLPPQRTGSWDGTHDGTRWGQRAVQNPSPPQLGGAGPGEVGEDCLVVNVTAPTAAVRGEGEPRPVLVWIHGGAFTIGSGNDYPAHELARREDLVVVTVGYRLGALGFLDLEPLDPSLAGSANHGIADQTAALGWVQDNIADFGGDPGNVTIAGESAGAISVMSILASPSADGRYHRAVANSTGGFRPSEASAHVLGLFDAALPGEGPLLDRLRAATTDQLLAAQVAAGFGFGSTIDGTVVTRTLDEAVARASSTGVPLLIGSNADEGTLFHAIAGGNAEIFELLTSLLPLSICPSGDIDRYRALLAEVHPDTAADDGGVARNLKIWNDFFRRPAVESAAVATEHGAGGWLYRFELPSTAFGGALGATHASEIAFTFDWLAGDGPLPGWTFHDRTDSTRSVAHAWSSAVARFARTGDPNGPGLPEWPRYSSDDRRVLVIDDPMRVDVDPDEADRKVWESL
ncbi:MAG: carboxylesterase/lipase family protein [Acidimicrobiia bacterium]